MSRTGWIIATVCALGAGGWAIFGRGGESQTDIEYRYQKAEKGELVRSINATGQLVALTKVDIRSKAGGKVIQLAVEEGDVVKKGDLIAIIDPVDTKATVDQAAADLRAAQARADSARETASLEYINRRNAVADAEVALQTAKTRLARIQTNTNTQPSLSKAELESAQAGLTAQKEALRQMTNVDVPRMRKDAQVSADRARVEMDNAKAELDRLESLLQKEFVSQSDVDRARTTYAAARANNANAQEKLRTVEQEIDVMVLTQKARVQQAEATLAQAQANQSKISTSKQDFAEAQQAVRSAELNLQRAKNDLAQVTIRESDKQSADASLVRNRVSLTNAEKQLAETTVVAPRDGVVTTKYLEEGTIIPPGTSTFSQGTAIVELSDITQMYVECAVDEADIAQVKLGQNVRILVEAYPGVRLRGVVERINPAAQTEQNITAIKVRVKVFPSKRDPVDLRPGMNSTCEFLTLEKRDVVVIPAQAILREGDKTFVRIKSSDPKKPTKVEVQLGDEGNEGYEVLKGVEPGQEVVTAEINLAQLREIQQRMQEAQQGGGLAATGGRPGAGGSRPTGGSRTGGAAGGGGGRPSGGAGGGR